MKWVHETVIKLPGTDPVYWNNIYQMFLKLMDKEIEVSFLK